MLHPNDNAITNAYMTSITLKYPYVLNKDTPCGFTHSQQNAVIPEPARSLVPSAEINVINFKCSYK